MPWKETCAVEQRLQFVIECKKGELSKAALCRAFEISRPTGEKWLARYADAGLDGLRDRSRAPWHHPNQIARDIEDTIIEARCAHPCWGPKKLRIVLQRRWPHRRWPACSTIGEVLRRHGLTVPRKRRRRTPPHEQPFASQQRAFQM